jgi:outer membrane protein, heavy metal efflux system
VAAAALLALAAHAGLAGCQTYEPRPPSSPVEHRREWLARSDALAGGALAPFLARLEEHARPHAGALALDDGLSLAEAQLVALAYNPGLRLARLRLGVAAAGAEHAGRWADPGLSFDVVRFVESVPDPWVATLGLAFTLPTSGVRAAERSLAVAEQRAAEAALVEAEWSLRRDVAAAWIAWSAARLRMEETERHLAGLAGLVVDAELLAERGELVRAEAALLRIALAGGRAELLRLAGEAAALEQRTRALLGLAPEAPVELVPALAAPAGETLGELLVVDDALERIERRSPLLARLRAEHAVAEEALRREIRAQAPDLALGPRLESDEGRARAGLLGALPLPLWNANRRAIAEARAARELARVAIDAGREELVGLHAQARVRLAALEAQRAELEATLIPLALAQLADARALMRLGEGSALLLFESLAGAIRSRLELIAAREAEALARVELAHLLGPAESAVPPAPPEEQP